MSRKEETIQLLHYLIKQYKNKPEIADIRLGQLLMNVAPDESRLFNAEARELKKGIDALLGE